METSQFHYRLLIAIAMFYMLAVISSDLLTYKIFQLGGINGSASLIIFPIIYLISDIINEVYGRKLATYLLFCSLAMEFIFDVILSQIIYLPSPISFKMQSAYEAILGPLPHIYWGLIIALTISSLINITIMAWWKKKLNNRYYLMRSFCSTIIGVFFFTIIGYSIWFYNIKPFPDIVELIGVSFFSKIVITAIMVWPSAQIVKHVRDK
ncbi:queuosine precursor transporter [Shewanella surugensis]|uniref:Queuosine precursor transporter n=1 Tax=Shewanella surugensis TaxID=212020 RepID=A0ABT0LB95_9GAMM|nr:queuosine precursor transporter [Shewanella surugensis]MCL1124770.1 queuosine precursor transporter [Shewanella surugensis]